VLHRILTALFHAGRFIISPCGQRCELQGKPIEAHLGQARSQWVLDSAKVVPCHCSWSSWIESQGAAEVRTSELHPSLGWCGSVGYIRPWPPACTGVVCSRVWGHGSLPENSGVFPPGLEWVAASSEGVQVSRGLVHEWGLNGAENGQTDWCSVCSNAGAVPVHCGEGEALELQVHLRSNLHLWSRALGSDRKNEIADTSG